MCLLTQGLPTDPELQTAATAEAQLLHFRSSYLMADRDSQADQLQCKVVKSYIRRLGESREEVNNRTGLTEKVKSRKLPWGPPRNKSPTMGLVSCL